jgi:hypothetical protein
MMPIIMKAKTKPTKAKSAKATIAPTVETQPESPKPDSGSLAAGSLAPDKVEISIRVPHNGRIFHAKSEFNLDIWKSSKTEPSSAQFIIGTLLNAMRQQGYAE